MGPVWDWETRLWCLRWPVLILLAELLSGLWSAFLDLWDLTAEHCPFLLALGCYATIGGLVLGDQNARVEHGGWDLWDWETRLWTGDGMAAWWVFFY